MLIYTTFDQIVKIIYSFFVEGTRKLAIYTIERLNHFLTREVHWVSSHEPFQELQWKILDISIKAINN